jgi:translation elongation factor EF-4
MKSLIEAAVGETLYDATTQRTCVQPFAGFIRIKPTVYSGLFPVDPADYNDLKLALERLCLNDSSVVVQPDSSMVLGNGWRIGFLGVLHMEVSGGVFGKCMMQILVGTEFSEIFIYSSRCKICICDVIQFCL